MRSFIRPAAAAIPLIVLTACVGEQGIPSQASRHFCAVTPGNRTQGALGVSEQASWRAKLGPGKELSSTPATLAAGSGSQALTVSGTVSDSNCLPLAGAALDAWHATPAGTYGPGQAPGDLKCCYLTGSVRTDRDGRYELDTVMPGHYGGGPAHIHIAVSGPRGGQLLTELHFAGDPVVNEAQDQINVASLVKTRDGSLHATFDIVLASG